jgi:hypothetical protein
LACNVEQFNPQQGQAFHLPDQEMVLRDRPSNSQVTKSLPLLYMIVLTYQGVLDMQDKHFQLEAQVRDTYTAWQFSCHYDTLAVIMLFSKGLVDGNYICIVELRLTRLKGKDPNV